MDGFTDHGGRLDAAMPAWPDAPTPWVDLSTGSNPRPYPAPRAALEAVAAVAFGLDDPARVAVTPGAESAPRLPPRLIRAETAWIAEPTCPSHADAWSRAGARRVASEAEAAVAVVVNPNNPDGRVLDHGALGVRLGGAVRYDGVPTDRPVFGEGPLRAAGDLTFALKLCLRARGPLWLAVGALACRR